VPRPEVEMIILRGVISARIREYARGKLRATIPRREGNFRPSPPPPLNFSRPAGVSTIPPVFRNSGLTSVPLIVDMAAGRDSLVYIRH